MTAEIDNDRFQLFERIVRQRCDIRTLRTRGRESPSTFAFGATTGMRR